MKSISTIAFNHQKVLLRADLNVPIANGKIGDDFRLRAMVPTINLILKNKGIPIIVTHIGRPHTFEEDLSTKHLIPWFTAYGYHLIFAHKPSDVPAHPPENSVILLENLRFNPGEKNHNAQFAQSLADMAPYYVNDAFALLHRDDTSITDVPKLYQPSHRFMGPLIEKELTHLNRLKENPAKPFIAILGGGKVSTKVPLINALIDKTQAILLCPAIVFTFLKVVNKPYGKSLVDDGAEQAVKKIIGPAHEYEKQLIFPVDYLVAHGTLDGPLKLIDAEHFPSDGIGISIGPKTLTNFEKYIDQAQTIFVNAAMGFENNPATKKYTYELLRIIAKSSAYKVAGGGNTIEDINAAGLTSSFDFLSTGGGATMAYLAGQPLPGLMALEE